MDHGAFYHEHGIGAQIPFIRRYFPESRIVPILLEEGNRRSDLLVSLSRQILPVLQRRRDVLVILSTDFTHHADQAKLDRSDSRTFRFFRDISADAAPLAGCDSRAGILVLSLLAEGLQRCNALILAYADSGKISAVHEDMTSYFFTFLY
jgi:AmmeMemoRadiSam system protein B